MKKHHECNDVNCQKVLVKVNDFNIYNSLFADSSPETILNDFFAKRGTEGRVRATFNAELSRIDERFHSRKREGEQPPVGYDFIRVKSDQACQFMIYQTGLAEAMAIEILSTEIYPLTQDYPIQLSIELGIDIDTLHRIHNGEIKSADISKMLRASLEKYFNKIISEITIFSNGNKIVSNALSLSVLRPDLVR